MPLLKDLACSIELSDSQQTLQEFGTIYGDGFVETFVPVPSRAQPFSIHLTSNKFIAPGIAMYVFVDGVYQCNRNRQDLKLRKPSDGRSLVDFKVRQKEEKQNDGSMIAREWTFEKLNSVQADGAPNLCSPNILDNIGCIEVVVLRCAGSRNAKSASHMNLDGATDHPDHYFGLDSHPQPMQAISTYDDRTLDMNGFANGYGPPPPMPSYRSPYVESVQSHEDAKSHNYRPSQTSRHPSYQASIIPQSRAHTRYSEPISPGTRPRNNTSPPGFQYGSGPIPPEGVPFLEPPSSAVVAKPLGVDPVWLDKLLTKAVKQGVKESRRGEPPATTHTTRTEHRVPNFEPASQPPGAWPTSPFTKPPQPYQQSEFTKHNVHNHQVDQGATWVQPQVNWNENQAASRRGTHVTWNAEPAWESESNANGWASLEETPDDSWDTDETWATAKPRSSSSSDFGGKSSVSAARKYIKSQASSPMNHKHSRKYSTDGHSKRSKSKPRRQRSRREYEPESSTDDNEGWTHIDATSSSTASSYSSDDTVQAPKSRSQTRTSKAPIERQSYRSKSIRTPRDRKLSQPSQPTYHVPAWQATPLRPTHVVPAPSIITPTVMNAPISATVPASVYSMKPAEVHSKKASIYTEPATSIIPPPVWGCATSEELRKPSRNSGSMAPAPYASSLKNFVHNMLGSNPVDNRSTPSSSWGSGKKDDGAQDSWGGSLDKTPGWNEPVDHGWGHSANAELDKSGWGAASANANSDWKVANKASNFQPTGWVANNDWVVEDTSKQTIDAGAGDSWEVKKDDWNTAKAADVPWPNQGNAWNVVDNNDKNNVQWGANNVWSIPALPTETPKVTSVKDTTKAASTSKRHSNKSLTKYRHLRSTSADLTPKPHWQFPPLPTKKQLTAIPEDSRSSKILYVAPKEPLYQINQETANEKGVEHQVRAGKGMQYGHAIGRPEYLDRLDKPYAVFHFKYRSRSILQSLFGDAIPSHGPLTLPTPTSTLAKEKEALKTLPQDQLIEKMLKLQTKLGAQEQARKVSRSSHHRKRKEHKHKHHDERKERRPSDSQKTEVVARDLTENWVKQHSRDPSEKGREKEKAKSVGKEKKEAAQTWGQTGGGDGAWPSTVW